jgi:hypothetical protein
MGPIEPIGSDPIGPPPPVARPFRVARDRREREPDDRERRAPDEQPGESLEDGEEEQEDGGHIDVTV